MNGEDKCVTVLASKFGQMALGTKDSGKIIRRAGTESFFMWMAIFSKENGRTIKLMEMAFTGTSTGLFMMANGLTIR